MDSIFIVLVFAMVFVIIRDVLKRNQPKTSAWLDWRAVSMDMNLFCVCGQDMKFSFEDSEIRYLTCVHCKKKWELPTTVELTDMEQFNGQR